MGFVAKQKICLVKGERYLKAEKLIPFDLKRLLNAHTQFYQEAPVNSCLYVINFEMNAILIILTGCSQFK